ADRGCESVPIGHAECLGDQFKALADRDLETLRGKSRTQGVRHGFGVAEVAHILILCLNETGVPGLALLTRSFGQRAMKAAIRSPYPEGRKQQVVSTHEKGGPLPGRCQSPRRVTTGATPSPPQRNSNFTAIYRWRYV